MDPAKLCTVLILISRVKLEVPHETSSSITILILWQRVAIAPRKLPVVKSLDSKRQKKNSEILKTLLQSTGCFHQVQKRAIVQIIVQKSKILILLQASQMSNLSLWQYQSSNKVLQVPSLILLTLTSIQSLITAYIWALCIIIPSKMGHHSMKARPWEMRYSKNWREIMTI